MAVRRVCQFGRARRRPRPGNRCRCLHSWREQAIFKRRLAGCLCDPASRHRTRGGSSGGLSAVNLSSWLLLEDGRRLAMRRVLSANAVSAVPRKRAFDRSSRAAGGVVISPDTWAGLDRAPNAPTLRGFHVGCAPRLQSPLTAGSLDHDAPLTWNGLVATHDR